jgi:hypothetical protein
VRVVESFCIGLTGEFWGCSAMHPNHNAPVLRPLVGWEEHGVFASARATFRMEATSGRKKWAYPKAGPETHGLLGCMFSFGCRHGFRLGRLSRLFLRCEVSFGLEGHSIDIDTIDPSGGTERLPSVCLGSGGEEDGEGPQGRRQGGSFLPMTGNDRGRKTRSSIPLIFYSYLVPSNRP